MIPFKNDLTIELISQSKFSDAQIFLREFAGKTFSKDEAQVVWGKVVDHKWYVSERLQRDIGLRVATLDFIENIYEPSEKRRSQSGFLSFLQRVFNPLMPIMNAYFTAKGEYPKI